MYRVSASRALSNARSTLVRRSEAVAPANAEKLLEAGKGDWKAMSIADKAALYRAEYGECRSEMGRAHTKEDTFVLGGIIAGVTLSFALYQSYRHLWLKPVPKTFDPEWVEATKEYLKKQNANPITGISSKA